MKEQLELGREEAERYAAMLERRDPTLIPEGRKLFKEATETGSQLFIAAQLVAVGDRDPVYWELLVKHARAAIERDGPTPFLLRFPGDKDRNPLVKDWATEQGIDAEGAFRLLATDDPLSVRALGMAADERAYPLLVRALASNNPSIVWQAALGLARLGRPESAELIEGAARAAPKEMQLFIAQALLYFDERSQKMAEELIEDKKILAYLKEQVAAKGKKGIYGF